MCSCCLSINQHPQSVINSMYDQKQTTFNTVSSLKTPKHHIGKPAQLTTTNSSEKRFSLLPHRAAIKYTGHKLSGKYDLFIGINTNQFLQNGIP